MKDFYINSRLVPVLVNPRRDKRVRNWIFTAGESWLLLTPERLARLAHRLGVEDWRIFRLVGLLRRYSGNPGAFCRRLGLPAARHYPVEDYPLTLCPACDGVHNPHPEDVGLVCAECREREWRGTGARPGGGELLDREADRLARQRFLELDPSSFYQGQLAPNHKYNLHRRLDRDWESAVNRILMGHPYRRVAKEFDCSVGLLHKKVKEKYWENN